MTIHNNNLYNNYLLVKQKKEQLDLLSYNKLKEKYETSNNDSLVNNSQIIDLSNIDSIISQKYNTDYNIYVLWLIDGNDEALYVGKTSRAFEIRLNEHKRGKGSEFTSTFKYGKIIPLLNDHYQSDENLDMETNLTFTLMKHFGYENVRGGTFNKVVIKNDPTKKKMHIDRYVDEPVEDYIKEIYDILKDKKSKLIKNH